MSHISTSKDCHLKGLCRKITKHKVTDGRGVIDSIVRDEKALNKKLRALDSEEQRALNKLNGQIAHLKNRNGHHYTAAPCARRHPPDVSGAFDQNGFDVASGRSFSWARDVGHHDSFEAKPAKRKAKPRKHPTLSRFPSASPPLQPRRLCDLRRNAPLSRSQPDLLDLSSETTRLLAQSPANKQDRGTESCRPQNPKEAVANNDQKLGGSLPNLSTRASSCSTKNRETSRNPCVRSVSLHDAMFSGSLQDLRDATAPRQRPRASSLRLQSGDASAERTVDRRSCALRYGHLASPLANRKHITNRCCCHNMLADGKPLNKNFSTLCQSENDPNSVEILMRCRYLRIPPRLYSSSASVDSGFD